MRSDMLPCGMAVVTYTISSWISKTSKSTTCFSVRSHRELSLIGGPSKTIICSLRLAVGCAPEAGSKSPPRLPPSLEGQGKPQSAARHLHGLTLEAPNGHVHDLLFRAIHCAKARLFTHARARLPRKYGHLKQLRQHEHLSSNQDKRQATCAMIFHLGSNHGCSRWLEPNRRDASGCCWVLLSPRALLVFGDGASHILCKVAHSNAECSHGTICRSHGFKHERDVRFRSDTKRVSVKHSRQLAADVSWQPTVALFTTRNDSPRQVTISSVFVDSPNCAHWRKWARWTKETWHGQHLSSDTHAQFSQCCKHEWHWARDAAHAVEWVHDVHNWGTSLTTNFVPEQSVCKGFNNFGHCLVRLVDVARDIVVKCFCITWSSCSPAIVDAHNCDITQSNGLTVLSGEAALSQLRPGSHCLRQTEKATHPLKFRFESIGKQRVARLNLHGHGDVLRRLAHILQSKLLQPLSVQLAHVSCHFHGGLPDDWLVFFVFAFPYSLLPLDDAETAHWYTFTLHKLWQVFC